MNIKKSVIYLLFVFLSVVFSSCSSVPDQDKLQKITPDEYARLCDYARTVIADYREDFITKEEKRIIFQKEPVFKVNYSADKYGTYDLSWNIGNKTVNYMGDGSLTNPTQSFNSIIVISTSVTPIK